MSKYAGLFLLAALLQAQPAKAPVIPDSMQRDYFKAQVEISRLQAQMADAQKAAQDVVTKMQAVCGADWQLRLDPETGNPVCGAKPAQK